MKEASLNVRLPYVHLDIGAYTNIGTIIVSAFINKSFRFYDVFVVNALNGGPK